MKYLNEGKGSLKVFERCLETKVGGISKRMELRLKLIIDLIVQRIKSLLNLILHKTGYPLLTILQAF